MRERRPAESAAEFDRRFDEGEDIHDMVDLSKTRITCPGRKVRITLDIPEALVRDIDEVRERIGVDRAALIKIWLHERVIREKTGWRVGLNRYLMRRASVKPIAS